MRISDYLRAAGIVVLTTLVVVGIAVAVHQVRPPGYTAEAVLVVPSNGNTVKRRLQKTYQGPGLEDEAQKLAVTFAGLIPNDQAVLEAAGRRLRRSTTDIQDRLTVVNDTNTALVRIRYKGGSPTEALQGAAIVADAVSGNSPVSRAIPSGALMLIRLPTSTTSAYTVGLLVGIAAVLGIALGLLLVVVRNRASPRIATSRDAEALLRVRAISAQSLSPEVVELVVQDWCQIGARISENSRFDHTVTTVGLIPVTNDAVAAAAALAGWMTSSHASREAYPQRDRVHIAVSPRDERAGELDLGAIARYDVLVLVIAVGTPTRRVSAILDLLAELSRGPLGAIIVTRRGSDLPVSTTPPSEPPSGERATSGLPSELPAA